VQKRRPAHLSQRHVDSEPFSSCDDRLR
jgi:hypothetical protein